MKGKIRGSEPNKNAIGNHMKKKVIFFGLF